MRKQKGKSLHIREGLGIDLDGPTLVVIVVQALAIEHLGCNAKKMLGGNPSEFIRKEER